MEFVKNAIKLTTLLRRTFKILSILFGLLALSPIVFGIVSNFLPSEARAFSNSYSTNMSFLLTQVFATAFTFVALDYLLKPRIRDLKEVLGFEQNRDVVSALIGSYTRNIRHNAAFLLVVSAGFMVSALWQLATAIQWTSLPHISSTSQPLDLVYFLMAFQPFLTALVLILLALFLARQAKSLKSGLAKLESPNIDLN
jgi:hypothetical protein